MMTTGTAALGATLPEPAKQERVVYVGTYTNTPSKSEGLYVCTFNPETGALTQRLAVGGLANPSFLAIDPTRKYLYAVNETGNFNGKRNGGLTAFAIDQKTGGLKKLNDQMAPGVPCHVSVHPSGRLVFAADYGGGNAVIFPVNADGSLAPLSDIAQHAGKGVNAKRQEGPHAHSANIDEAGRFVFVPDLGIDRVMIYRIDERAGKFVPNGFAPTKPGAGPRHFVFHPSGKFAYVINELDSTITAFTYDKNKGALAELQSVPTIPADFTQNNQCADIHIHPTGKFLYGSNRGHDTIAVFALNPATGKLAFVQHQSTLGKWPRNFAIDPSGQFLLAANERTDNIATFRIDGQTGRLTPTGQEIKIPAPVCIRF